MEKVIGEYFIKEGETGSQLCQVVEADKYYRQEFISKQGSGAFSVGFLLALFALLWFVWAHFVRTCADPDYKNWRYFFLSLGIIFTGGLVCLIAWSPGYFARLENQSITQDVCLPLESFEQYDLMFKTPVGTGV